MKISQQGRKTVLFESIKVGEVFKVNEVFYMRTIPSVYNAVRLSDGETRVLFDNLFRVEVVDGEFVVKDMV